MFVETEKHVKTAHRDCYGLPSKRRGEGKYLTFEERWGFICARHLRITFLIWYGLLFCNRYGDGFLSPRMEIVLKALWKANLYDIRVAIFFDVWHDLSCQS